VKNNKLPTSPHLQIYKPQMTSILSITHRITGFCLSLTLPLYLIWLGCIYFGELAYNKLVIFCSYPGINIIFILMAYGFFYHMLNGIRHLFWDIGFGISIKFSSISGIVIIILSLSLTLVIGTKFIF
tara:strand:- start:158 stop:538 length:381 start_codon:yes stop_codon:yes gene_type:complete